MMIGHSSSMSLWPAPCMDARSSACASNEPHRATAPLCPVSSDRARGRLAHPWPADAGVAAQQTLVLKSAMTLSNVSALLVDC